LLICDDSTTERSALAQILRRRGYELDEAADGAAALLLLKRRPYDLLLLDLQMPGVDGFDVLAYVQKHLPDLPVVVLSGLPPDAIGGGIQRLPQHELPPLLLKPIDTGQLFQVIELKLAGELP
jgi:CheY-like chemotaxis protein